ncbi:MAG TPA: hypothetical protein VEV16_00655, partial [Daejeonella sp.]|nr:hypothetical protein [Daejeonella sp.]
MNVFTRFFSQLSSQNLKYMPAAIAPQLQRVSRFGGMRKNLSLLLLVLIGVLSGSLGNKVYGQVVTPFNIRYQIEQRGGIVYLSNNSLTAKDYDKNNSSANKAVKENPPKGSSNNDSFTSVFIDVDNDNSTFNSSSSDLLLPACSKITFAGLYWGGSTAKPVSGRNKVKLKLPNETGYMDIVADEDFGAYGNEHYQCFKDITDLVNNNSQINGTYWVANVDAQEGKIKVEAGWTIVIVYQNDLAPSYRNLTVFDGLAGIEGVNSYNIPIKGFLTPPAGPVNFELGFVAYEGDRGISGDYMSFDGNILADAAHSTNNTFNASITYNGNIVTTRNPAHANTLGYDASILMFPNKSSSVKLGNNISEAKITLATTQDRYAIGVVTTAIDVLNPYYTFHQSFSNITNPGQPVKVGETVEFTYTLKNIGSDISKNTVFTNTISPLLTNISQLQTKTDNGAWVNYSTNKDGDAAEFVNNQVTFRVGSGANSTKGGNVNALSTVTIKFRATLTGNCDLL